MISRRDGCFYLTCDVCQSDADNAFLRFDEAVAYKRTRGWKSQRRDGEWEDVCPDCQEANDDV